MNYTNARRRAVFTDWPFGRELKCEATFTVESKPGKGERVSRVTIDPRNGRPSAPKTTTYGARCAIVDGDDGRTYVATLLPGYGFVSIMQSNLQLQAESVHKSADPVAYEALRALIEGAQ